MPKKKVVLDARGAKIDVGATVIWLAGGGNLPGVYTVTDVKTRVKLGEWTWVNSYNLFVVDSVPEPYKRQEEERYYE